MRAMNTKTTTTKPATTADVKRLYAAMYALGHIK